MPGSLVTGTFFPVNYFFKEAAVLHIFVLQSPHKISQKKRHKGTLITNTENH